MPQVVELDDGHWLVYLPAKAEIHLVCADEDGVHTHVFPYSETWLRVPEVVGV